MPKLTNNVFGESSQNSAVSYLFSGSLAEGTSGIVTFSKDLSGVESPGDALALGVSNDGIGQFLMESYTVQFNRPVQTRYFINKPGAAYMLGRAQGTYRIDGLIGSAEAFGGLQGVSDTESGYCAKPLIAVIETPTVGTCSADGNGLASQQVSKSKLILRNLIAQGITTTATMEQDGTLFLRANVTFLFTGMQWTKGSTYSWTTA